jgi:hypothetical protein
LFYYAKGLGFIDALSKPILPLLALSEPLRKFGWLISHTGTPKVKFCRYHTNKKIKRLLLGIIVVFNSNL